MIRYPIRAVFEEKHIEKLETGDKFILQILHWPVLLQPPLPFGQLFPLSGE